MQSGSAAATDLVLFHMDGHVANILARSDDITNDVGPVDTTMDNDTTARAFKDFKIIVQPDGSAGRRTAANRIGGNPRTLAG